MIFTVLPRDHGIRPAGPRDECFYCGRKIGEAHKPDCVTIQKKVRVRYSFEIEVDAPFSFDKDNIEFGMNESSWCASNALTRLQALDEESGCLCDVFHGDVISMSDEPFVNEQWPEDDPDMERAK